MEQKSKEVYFDKLPDSFVKKTIGKENGSLEKCYLLEDIFENPMVFKKLPGMDKYKDSYKFLASHSSDTFIFPKTLVYLKNPIINSDMTHEEQYSFFGYLMEYINGITLKHLGRDVSINEFIEALKVVELAIKYDISANYMELCDMNPKNVIFTPDKKLKIIDTDLYEPTDEDDIGYLYRHNLREFNNDIFSYIFPYSWSFENNFLGLNDVIKSTIFGDIKAHEMLETFQEKLSNYQGEQINTLSELDKSLALVKKR